MDTATFDLQKDKFLLDYTYSSSHVDQNILLNVYDFTNYKSIDISRLPKLFFSVVINQSGEIVSVNYDSWGIEIYRDLIDEIKVILLKKSIKPYEILGYPINVKLDIGVIIR